MSRRITKQALAVRCDRGRTRGRGHVRRRRLCGRRHDEDELRPRPEPQVRQLPGAISRRSVPRADRQRRRPRRPERPLTLHLKNIKPGLAFDLFTVERSTLDAQGNPIPGAELRPRLVPVGPRGATTTASAQRQDPDDPARPDLRLRPDVAPAADQHVPRRLLVQRPERRGGVRLRRRPSRRRSTASTRPARWR